MSEQTTTEEPNFSAVLSSVFGNHKLYPYVWTPAVPAKVLLYISHGVGEHMKRYDELGNYLAESGILVFGHDHVGHGRSGGDRVHIEDIDMYVQDVISHVEQMKNQYPHLPCILMGHSMGGLVAEHVAIQRGDLFTALVLSGAVAETDPKFSSWFVKTIFQLVSRVLPQVGARNLNPEDISSIPEEVKRYVEDPLVWHGALKMRWGAAMLESIDLLRQNVGLITLPVLIMHGTDDHLVLPSSSQFIYENCSSQDKRLQMLEGSRHEILHDKEQENVRETIKEWILAHLFPPTSQSSSQEQQSEVVPKPQTSPDDSKKEQFSQSSTAKAPGPESEFQLQEDEESEENQPTHTSEEEKGD